MKKLIRLLLIALLVFGFELMLLASQSIQNSNSHIQNIQILAQTPDNLKAKADKLFQQGLQQYENGKVKKAIQFWQQALNIYQKIGNKLKVANSLNQLGIAYFSQDKYQKAKEFHEQALAIAREINSQQEEAKSLNGLGNALSPFRQPQQAIKLHEQSLAISRKLELGKQEVDSLNGLGNSYFYLRQYDASINFYKQSLAISRKINYQKGEAKALTNIGTIYIFQNQYERAVEFLEQSLPVAREVKDKRTELINLISLGLTYQSVGQYQKAIESHLQVLAINRELGNKTVEMSTLGNLGMVYRNLEQYQKAIDFAQQTLVLAKELGDEEAEAKSYGNLGVSNYFLGRYQKAIKFHEQSLAIDIKLGSREGEGLTLGNLGLAYSSLEEYQKAMVYYRQSLVIARELKDRLREGNALNNIGRAYISLRQYTNASTTLLQAINVYDKYLRTGLSDANKISIFDTYSRSYRLLQQAYIGQNQTNNALEIAEQGKARAFVELLSYNFSEKPNNQLNIKPLKIEEICQIAQEQNATLVQYSIHEPQLYIWVIKPTGEITFKQVDIDTSLQSLVNLSREAIGVRGRSSIEVEYAVDETTQAKKLHQLYKLLIEPIADLLPSDKNSKIIFIPQGQLFLVPFPALQDAKGKYLIEKHTFLTAPAIQVLDLIHQQSIRISHANLQKTLVVGNPTMPKVPTRLGDLPQQLSKLPSAEQEANEIAKLFKTKAFIGDQATKATILPKLSQARIIHLATHGLLDDVKGLGVPGAIALAPSGNGELNDGLLTANEILNLKLNAELVVLSACDTGRGRITGDGVIGLSRSLITAGTPSVIVSLWSVPDAPTAELMTEFYRNWLDGKLDKAQALRQAMLTTMKHHPNPKDWAAFTLIGEAK